MDQDNNALDSYEIAAFNNIREVGKQIVAKRNDLIQEARFSLTNLEFKAFNYIVSKIKPDDDLDKTYSYYYSEMLAVMGYKTTSYTEARKVVQRLNSYSFWRDAVDDGEDDVLIQFFDGDSISSNKEKGKFFLRFSQRIRPYIMNLKNQYNEDGIYYTMYELQNVALMSHYYSQRIYELLKSYERNRKSWIFEIGTDTNNDLQRRIAKVDQTGKPIIPESWKNWHKFERDVLKPAEKEINNLSDIKIAYTPSKTDLSGVKHRRYSSVEFIMLKKTSSELKDTEEVIEGRYREIQNDIESSAFRQMRIDDFIAEHEIKGNQEASEDVLSKEKANTSTKGSTDTKTKEMSGKRSSDKADAKDISTGKSQTESLQDDTEELQSSDKWNSVDVRTAMPFLYEVLSKDFTLRQIEVLVDYSFKHIEFGAISFKDKEGWLTDYISHYRIKVWATDEDTKTTPFYRLLDMVNKDYDGYAKVVTDSYIRREVNNY